MMIKKHEESTIKTESATVCLSVTRLVRGFVYCMCLIKNIITIKQNKNKHHLSDIFTC